MLFRADTLKGIAAHEVTLAFRRWRRPTVRAGGTLRTRVGVLAIESVDVVDPERVTDEQARRAGHPDRDALMASLRPEGELYRVTFRLAGPDPRIALRERSRITAAERAELDVRLARMDAGRRGGPWTAAMLELIAERPETKAEELAAALGREKLPFKADVRRLKELGLTESLLRGYRLSPRGRAYLAGRGPRGGASQ